MTSYDNGNDNDADDDNDNNNDILLISYTIRAQ